ncbi:hypothetical protein RclHR1_00350005 [Rhizophagus clarus]|uniref:Uncharacterized protein n=1 Tax=Rhizophagus clarus TaxID=94130 RepID=A0A2Z6RQQ3_9GLOM|nr:hypothetical protein RclHR1_00350005 [Rhizophagus clarus]
MTRSLPTFSFSNEPKSNDELKLEIISYIESHNTGWTNEFIQSGKKFIRDLAVAFWYIDKCGFKTFNDRFTIPADFLQFVNRYDLMKNKKSYPKFIYDELNHHHQNLNAYLKMSWMDHSCFSFLKSSLAKFTVDLINYTTYLVNKVEQTKKNYESITLILNEEDAGKLKIIAPVILRNPVVIKKYKDLIDVIEVATYWEEINVDQFYSENIFNKSRYLQKLEEVFSFKVEIYTYHHGNVINTTFVWKIDPNVEESTLFEKNYEI